ncbi:MAG: cold shock domain-containing protein [Actinomycetota bacterium]|jgi:cold shock CspA family protein|nr:cold shock domain-containing protein [Actinomycetota bacterium]
MAQGTIKDFDDQTRSGTLLQDDRSEVLIDAESLEGAGIRTLRLGQRVIYDLADESGSKVARRLRLVTFT